jgi:hypothetical protein
MLRAVRRFHGIGADGTLTIMQKLGNWFRYRYQSRKDDKASVKEIIQCMSNVGNNRPKRTTELSKYFELHWDDKIKPVFDALWEGCLHSSLCPKKCISFVKKLTADAWSRESDAMKSAISTQCDEEHDKVLEEWRTRTNWVESPESFEM